MEGRRRGRAGGVGTSVIVSVIKVKGEKRTISLTHYGFSLVHFERVHSMQTR